MDRPDPRVRVRRQGRGVERGVLDVVAHPHHVLLAHRLDVHERAAVRQLELAVVTIAHGEAEVHELWRRADVELQTLEHGRDVVAVEAQRALHPLCVDGARAHPLLDGDVAHAVGPERQQHVREAGSVDQVARQQELGHEHRELLSGKLLEGIARTGHGSSD
jgi:hypothetical protein